MLVDDYFASLYDVLVIISSEITITYINVCFLFFVALHSLKYQAKV